MIMWGVVVASGIATFAIRFSLIALFGRFKIHPTVESGLRFISPSVLAALTLPAVISPGGTIDPWNAMIPALVVSGLAAWYTRSIGAAIVTGLPALWLIQWLTRF